MANKDPEARSGAAGLAADLDGLVSSVPIDDRQASPGVKFKDASCSGVPWIIVVGRGLGRRRGRAAEPVQPVRRASWLPYVAGQ